LYGGCCDTRSLGRHAFAAMVSTETTLKGSTMTVFMDYVKYVAKALATAAVIILSYLTSVLTDGETLADVSLVQWMVCGVWVLAGFGITYAIPNGPPPAVAAQIRTRTND